MSGSWSWVPPSEVVTPERLDGPFPWEGVCWPLQVCPAMFSFWQQMAFTEETFGPARALHH